MTILAQLVESTRRRVTVQERSVPLSQVRELAETAAIGAGASGTRATGAGAMAGTNAFPFEKALQKPGLSFICEVKRASPSKGIIWRGSDGGEDLGGDFPYLGIAKDYANAGADAISVLTEPEYFLGSNRYLAEISAAVGTPTLRKDFIISEYQVYESKTLGAAALLLITSILSDLQLAEYVHLAHSLGLSALVEARSVADVNRAIAAKARIIGVNNRNLENFGVDLHTAVQLRAVVPKNVLFVVESGIRTPDDIASLSSSRPDAVLIGEALMKAPNKHLLLQRFREAAW